MPRKAGRRAPTVVLADDSIFHRMMMRALLEAGDGREVLDLVKLARPDVVIMDIAMPAMDGVTAARRLRAQSGSVGRIPIVFLTALSASGDRDTALAAGGDDYLVKPISDRELLRVVRRYVDGAASSDS
jgi:CheY-like chemotaxis protein